MLWCLQVIGSYLRSCPSDRELWEEALEKLRRAREVHTFNEQESLFLQLRVSYKGLTEVQQRMFLDTACFLLGRRIDTAKRAWHGCAFELLRYMN